MARLRWLLPAAFVLFILLTFSASALIEYAWWNEMGQLETWYSMALYNYAPRFAAAILAFFVFRFAFLLGRRRARARARGRSCGSGAGARGARRAWSRKRRSVSYGGGNRG